MSSSDFSTDGALGNNSLGLNPLLVPGIMRGLNISNTLSNPPLGNLIASCEDFATSTPQNRYYVDDAANFYVFNGTSITKQRTGSATYKKGITDMIPFQSHFYISTTTTLTQWDGTSGGTFNESFKTFTNTASGLWRPLLVYTNALYFADGNILKTLGSDESTVTTIQIFPTNEQIVALGIDPATGLLLISVSTVIDISDTLSSKKIIYMHDGVSATFRRKIFVDDLVVGFYNVEGTVYVGAGLTIGEWNGSGITYLRKLYNATANNTDLPYKHNLSNVRNFLLVVDGQTLLAYGEVIAGKKAWFNTGYSISTNHITCISPTGTNKIGIAFANSGVFNLRIFDFAATVASFLLDFNNIYFPRPIFVRRVRIITTGVTTTTGDGSVSITDEKGINYTTSVSSFVVPSAQSPKYVFDYDFTQLKLQALQLSVDSPDQAVGFIRAIIYYDISE